RSVLHVCFLYASYHIGLTFFFFFSSRRRHTRSKRDWSSDVCSSDLGHVETVHSFTNDQNLIDNFHKGSRRGRAAGLNMVLTETGAATAVAKALPELSGKLSGNAIRVPTPNVSMAILNLEL